MKEIIIDIDSLGRVKKKGKGLGQQYENNVTQYIINLDSSLKKDDYYYYIVVVPPSASGKSSYAVPMLSEKFEYKISSAITQFLGTFKFCMLIMQKELEGTMIPTEGVVKISSEWEDEVEKGILEPDKLEEQPEDVNFNVAYEELQQLKVQIEKNSSYAKKQGDYAKEVGESLIQAKNNGEFKGEPGEKGEPGVAGVSGIYMGEEEPSDENIKVWINPYGEVDEYYIKERFKPLVSNLESNKLYRGNISESISFILPMVNNNDVLNTIEIQANISNYENITIDLGATKFFGDIPELSNGSFIIYYEYDGSNWCVGALPVVSEV